MKRIITTLMGILLIGLILHAQEAPPQAFSFKATIKDSRGLPVLLRKISLRISILQGDVNGLAVYSEYFNPTTNLYSQVDIEIGRGTVLSGSFSSVDWSVDAYYLKIEADVRGGTNYQLLSVTQLLSVPYALFAGQVMNNEDNDADPENEIQVLSLEGNMLTLSTNGTPIQVNLAPYLDNTDNQTLLLNDHQLTITNGNVIQLPDNVNDADADPTNELQVLSIGHDTIYLSDGGYVKLPEQTSGIWNMDAMSQNIINLAEPVNAQDAATKAYVDALLARIEAIEALELINYDFTDSRDSNFYNTVKIGNQVWMAENLKYLPSVAGIDTGSRTTPYYYVFSYYDTVEADAKALKYYKTYGVLYNWPAAMNGETSSTANPSGVQGVCPTGWHLPSDAEWTELTDYLLGTSLAGGQLKENGTTHWVSPNTGATNTSGFTALPGSFRNNVEQVFNLGFRGFWWSTTLTGTDPWGRVMIYNDSSVGREPLHKEYGVSVRCVRD